MTNIVVPAGASGAWANCAYFDDLEEGRSSYKTVYISFGEYDENNDRCSFTGIPDDMIFFYSSREAFITLFDETNGEDFILFGEPEYNMQNRESGRKKALEDCPMECIVMLSLPDNVLGKFYGSFADGGEAFDFIVNSIESNGNFAMFPLRNPNKHRSYHEWWLPEFVDSVPSPSDEFKYPNKKQGE
jgi:hypothetical protein